MAVLLNSNMKLYIQDSSGQGLVEVLSAMAIAISVLSALTIIVVSALNNAQHAKNQNLATQYAQQGMEHMRKLRDVNWGTFYTYGGFYCLDKNSSTLRAKGSGCGQNVENYIREVELEQDSSTCTGKEAKVVVSVYWADNTCTSQSNIFCHKVQLVSCLSDYRVVPTP
jgi:Tfp pilus assembly protein PilV